MDDIISVYYIFFYLLSNKKLPWNNIFIDDLNIKHEIFYKLKNNTNFYKFYENFPEIKNIIKKYYKYINYYHI